MVDLPVLRSGSPPKYSCWLTGASLAFRDSFAVYEMNIRIGYGGIPPSHFVAAKRPHVPLYEMPEVLAFVLEGGSCPGCALAEILTSPP